MHKSYINNTVGGVHLPEVLPYCPSTLPSQMAPDPFIDLTLPALPKASMSAMVYKQLSYLTSLSYCGYDFPYTEVSQSGVVFADHLLRAHLPGITSVLTAEIIAMLEAMEVICGWHTWQFLVFTD